MHVHTWQTPEALAERLDAHKYRDGWRACCPAHGGDNPQALSIRRGTDKHGNPCTLLYCHAYQCSILQICDALGITVVSLFSIHPTQSKALQYYPRGHDPRLERLAFWNTPHSKDDLAQAMLESEIVNDAGFLGRVPAARETFWRLAQEPGRKLALMKALADAKLPVQPTLDALQHEWGTHES